jgi:hypothetical protein
LDYSGVLLENGTAQRGAWPTTVIRKDSYSNRSEQRGFVTRTDVHYSQPQTIWRRS